MPNKTNGKHTQSPIQKIILINQSSNAIIQVYYKICTWPAKEASICTEMSSPTPLIESIDSYKLELQDDLFDTGKFLEVSKILILLPRGEQYSKEFKKDPGYGCYSEGRATEALAFNVSVAGQLVSCVPVSASY